MIVLNVLFLRPLFFLNWFDLSAVIFIEKYVFHETNECNYVLEHDGF